MLHHFPHQAIDGRWHVVTRCAFTGALQSVCDFLSEAEASTDAVSRNGVRAARPHQTNAEKGYSHPRNGVSRLFHGAPSRQSGDPARGLATSVGPAREVPLFAQHSLKKITEENHPDLSGEPV